MKRTVLIFISLIVLGSLGIFMYFESMGDERPYTAFSSTSPDGKWRCDVIDYDRNKYTFTYRFKMYKLVNGHEIDTYGTELIRYTDSAAIGTMDFSWSSKGLTVETDRNGIYDAKIVKRGRDIWWSKRDEPTIRPTEPPTSVQLP